MNRVSNGEAYAEAGASLVTGRYPIYADRLPDLADQSLEIPEVPHMTNADLAREHFPMPEQYEQLAWWTYQAFLDAASTSGHDIDLWDNFFEPNGAGFIGIFEMAQYLAVITNVYHKQAGRPDNDAEAINDIRSIAMRSAGLLELIASENTPVANHLEKQISLKKFDGTMHHQYDDHNHGYELVEGESGPYVTTRIAITDKIEAVNDMYLREMERTGLKPARTIGCFALKIAATPDKNVFHAVWHGMVLAGTNQQVVGRHLQELDARWAE